MKLSLSILAILCTFSAISQSPYVKPNNTYGIEYNRIKSSIVQHIPEKSAHEINTTDSSTQIYYYRPDSSFWGYNKVKGHFRIGSATGGGGGGSGSSSFYDFYARRGEVADTLFKSENGIENLVYVIDKLGNISRPGNITWSGFGYAYNITAGIWDINGQRVTTPAGSFTLDPPHSTLYRIDLIYANAAGQIMIRKGTPAPAPVPPDYDPSTEYKIGTITLTPNTNSPIQQLALALVYDEKNPSEWAISANAVTINDASTTTPFKGTKTIDVGTTTTASSIDATAPTAVDATNYNTFSFQIKLKSALNGNKKFTVSIYNGTNPISSVVSLGTNYGFNSSNTATYQNVVIPMSAFGLSQNAVTKVRISFIGATSGALIDYIKFEGGIQQPGGGGDQPLPIMSKTQNGIGKPGTGFNVDPDGTFYLADAATDHSGYLRKEDSLLYATKAYTIKVRDSVQANLNIETAQRVAADTAFVKKSFKVGVNNVYQPLRGDSINFNITGGGANDSAYTRMTSPDNKRAVFHSKLTHDTLTLVPDPIAYATADSAGIIKVGTGLAITNGVLSATGGGGGGATVDTLPLSTRITQNRTAISTKLNITDTANIRLRAIAGPNMSITGSYPNLTFSATGGGGTYTATDSAIYVSNFGNDANSGYLITAPKKTLAAAVALANAKVAANGSTAKVLLEAGSVFAESATLTVDGVTFSSYNYNDAATPNSSKTTFATLVGSDSYNTGWSLVGGQTYSYSQTIPNNIVNYPGYGEMLVTEIDTALERTQPLTARHDLTPVTSLATAESTAGSAFTSTTPASGTSNQSITIHPSNNLSPNNNPRYRYEVSVRNKGIEANNNGVNARANVTYEKIHIKGFGGGYGGIGGGNNTKINQVTIQGGPVHSVIMSDGSFTNSAILGGALGMNSGALVFYSGLGRRAHNLVKNAFFIDLSSPLAAHTSGGDNHGALEVDNVFVYPSLIGQQPLYFANNTDTTIINNLYTDSVGQIMSSVGVSPLNIIKNSVFKSSGIWSNSNVGNVIYYDNILWKGIDGLQSAIQYSSTNNSIIHIKTTASNVYGIRTNNNTTVKRTIFIGESTTPGSIHSPMQLKTGLSLDYNVYIRAGQGLIQWADNNGFYTITSLAAWKTATGQDANSKYIDLYGENLTLKDVFVDPDNGNYNLGSGKYADSIRLWQTQWGQKVGMTTPPSGWLKKPTYEQVKYMVENNSIPQLNEILSRPSLASSGSNSSTSTGWGLYGNAALSGSNFIGTTNNTSFRIKTKNVERVAVDSIGQLVIAGDDNGNAIIKTNKASNGVMLLQTGDNNTGTLYARTTNFYMSATLQMQANSILGSGIVDIGSLSNGNGYKLAGNTVINGTTNILGINGGSAYPNVGMYATGSYQFNNTTTAGGMTYDPSALVDIKSTTKGAYLPRGTKAQRDAISSPGQGLLFFVTDNGGYLTWYNSGWQKVSSIADP
jgi:hypothetical protein